MTLLATLTVLFALVSMSTAFMMQPSFRPMAVAKTNLNLMTQEEVEALITQANDCSEGECSLDEVGDLIEVLKAQQKELYDRVQQYKNTIRQLIIVNSKDNRKVDEVRETVRAIYRVFQLGDKASGNDYPKLSKPSGWSGEVGDGPKTAYDALPPKPYKATK